MEKIDESTAKVNEGVRFIKSWLDLKNIEANFDVGIILGTGTDGVPESMFVSDGATEDSPFLFLNEIPFFPPVPEFQQGKMFFKGFKGKRTTIMAGRPHLYQGYSMNEVVYPVNILYGLGVRHLILTNSSGGINPDLQIGDLVAITDHINFACQNPLVGLCSGFDLGDLYSKRLIKILEEVASKRAIGVKKGVYAYETGPVFETLVEARMLHAIGADAVGWSIVPEAIMAKFLGMEEILAISRISDMSYPAIDRKKIMSEMERPFSRKHTSPPEETTKNRLKILIEGVVEKF